MSSILTASRKKRKKDAPQKVEFNLPIPTDRPGYKGIVQFIKNCTDHRIPEAVCHHMRQIICEHRGKHYPEVCPPSTCTPAGSSCSSPFQCCYGSICVGGTCQTSW